MGIIVIAFCQLIVAGLVFFVISQIPMPETWRTVARYAFATIFTALVIATTFGSVTPPGDLAGIVFWSIVAVVIAAISALAGYGVGRRRGGHSSREELRKLRFRNQDLHETAERLDEQVFVYAEQLRRYGYDFGRPSDPYRGGHGTSFPAVTAYVDYVKGDMTADEYRNLGEEDLRSRTEKL